MSSTRMTLDQKQSAHRAMAAATVRQLATILKELSQNTLDHSRKNDYVSGDRALKDLANKIEEGNVNPRRWEFLTWLAEPKIDPDSLAPAAISVDYQFSGSKSDAREPESPSTPTASPSPGEPSPGLTLPWLEEGPTS